MSAKDSSVTKGLDRLNALFAWWGVPAAGGNRSLDRQMTCCQAFASDLQKVYGDAWSRQMDVVFAANERISRSLQEFLHCRQPQDVVAAESNVLATVLEGVSSQAKNWADLAQNVQGCCAARVREAADDIRKQAEETAPARPTPEAERPPTRQVGKQVAHA